MAVIIKVKEKERSEGYLLILEQLKATIVNVAELAIQLYERGKSEGLSNKVIRADIEEALLGIIQERRLRQILPSALKRALNITSVNSAINCRSQDDSTEELPYGVKLIQGDCTQDQIINDKIPVPLSLIFTDPPYNMESIELFSKLGELAMKVLKPGGSLVTYFGQYALPEVIQHLLNSGLKYNWIGYVKHGEINTFMHNNRVVVRGKPLLWFYKEYLLDRGEYASDFIESEAPDKSLHECAQSTVEAQHFISRLTANSQIVLDPFMGSGTTGISALKQNRQFIGIEINPQSFEVAQMNISSSTQLKSCQQLLK